MPTAIIEDASNGTLLSSHSKLPKEHPSNEAFVLLAKDQFIHERRPIPALPSDKHVLIAIKATGLCGSDVRFLFTQEPPLTITSRCITGNMVKLDNSKSKVL